MIKKLIYILLILPVYLSGQNNFFWSHAGVTIETNTLKEGLISCWEFDETSGTIIYDSHNGNNGTNYGATIGASGVIEKSYYFDGIGAYATLPYYNVMDFNPLTEEFTFNIWLKSSSPITTRTSYIFIGARPTNSISHTLFIYNDASGKVFISTRNHLNTQILSSGISNFFNGGNWNMLTVKVLNTIHSIGNPQMKIYKNGILQETVNITFTNFIKDTFADAYVASNNPPTANIRFYRGNIAQTSVWNRALTDTEIEALYNSGNGIAYTGWQGTGASSSTWSITPLFTKTLDFTPDNTWYAGSHSYGSNIAEDDKYIFIVFNKDNYLNHVVYRINKATGDTASQIIQTDDGYYGDHHKTAVIHVTNDTTLLVAIDKCPGNFNHGAAWQVFRWTDTDSLQNYTSTSMGNSTTERLSYGYFYEVEDTIIFEAKNSSTSNPTRRYYRSTDDGQNFGTITEYIDYGDSDYWIYAGQVGNNSKTNPILGITPAWYNPVQIYQYITFLKSDFTGNFYSLGGDNLGTLVSSVELKDNYTWGDTDENTNLKYARYSKVFGSYIYGLGLSGTRTSKATDVDSMQIFKVNTSTGVASNGDAFATTQSSTAIEYSIIFAYDGDMYVKFGEGGSIYYYRVKSDLSGMDLVLTESGNYHMGFLTDMYSELSADYNPTTKVLRIYRFDDPDGL